MADTENREDQKISECLREAFGYSDDQLLKQLDQANETFKDVNFTGAEDRLMKRFLARKAELEKETASQTPILVPQNESANIQIAEELPKKTVTVISEAEEKKKSEEKVIRFGKKKVLATAALVAVIAGMLGGTAIGKKSYFFRKSDEQAEILLDTAKNKSSTSELEEAYNNIRNTLNMPVLELGYYPDEMTFKDYEIYADGAQIRFLYQDDMVYIVQSQKKGNASAIIESDRSEKHKVFNKWSNKEIEYTVNQRDDGKKECGAVITQNNNYYYIFGEVQEEEFKKILEYFSFF